jgi:predicted nucleotidyltransferase
VARGEDTHDSDIDLIVDFGVEDDFLALGPLLEEVQSLLRVRVDLTCPQIAKQAVLEGALRDAIPL